MGKMEVCKRLLIISCICFLGLCIGNSAAAKEYGKTIGNFKYIYRDYKDSVWITEIIPVSENGIDKLSFRIL